MQEKYKLSKPSEPKIKSATVLLKKININGFLTILLFQIIFRTNNIEDLATINKKLSTKILNFKLILLNFTDFFYLQILLVNLSILQEKKIYCFVIEKIKNHLNLKDSLL